MDSPFETAIRISARYHQKYITGDVTCQHSLPVIFLDNLIEVLYFDFGMKNLELLKTGSKPAPGELVLVQGFVNTLDIETGKDAISTPGSLKAWAVRHGLMRSNEAVSENDLKSALTFREALRRLLLANNDIAIPSSSLRQLNRMVARQFLAVSFAADGTPLLAPTGVGIAKVLGLILAVVVQAVSDGTWPRLKACHDPECNWAFYDSAKNHSGRWCSMSSCGSRNKARTYRRRRSAREN